MMLTQQAFSEQVRVIRIKLSIKIISYLAYTITFEIYHDLCLSQWPVCRSSPTISVIEPEMTLADLQFAKLK